MTIKEFWRFLYILIGAAVIIFIIDSIRMSKKDSLIHTTYEKQCIYIDSIRTLNDQIFWLKDSINYLNQEIEYYEYIK